PVHCSGSLRPTSSPATSRTSTDRLPSTRLWLLCPGSAATTASSCPTGSGTHSTAKENPNLGLDDPPAFGIKRSLPRGKYDGIPPDPSQLARGGYADIPHAAQCGMSAFFIPVH